MNDVVQFLTANPIVFLATCDKHHHPRVRPFQFMLEQNGKLYFCTSNKKKVFAEMRYNPEIELSASAPDSSWLRLYGHVVFVKEPELNAEIKAKIIEQNPLVKSIYQTPDNPELILFTLTNCTATLSDFSGNPPRTYQF